MSSLLLSKSYLSFRSLSISSKVNQMAFSSPFSALHMALSSGSRPISLSLVLRVRVQHWRRHLALTPSLIFSVTVVWAATSNNSDFLRSEGLKKTISDPIHRQEIVAAGIGPFLLSRMNDFFILGSHTLWKPCPYTEYRESIGRISDYTSDFFEALSMHEQRGIPVALFIEEILRALSEACFLLILCDPTSW